MDHDVNKAPDSAVAASSEHPTYEPPVLIDYGTVAALTLGSGGGFGSDAWGAGGAGGGS